MNLSSSMACCEEDGEVLGYSARSPTKACLLISRGAIVQHHIEAYGASLSDAAGASYLPSERNGRRENRRTAKMKASRCIINSRYPCCYRRWSGIPYDNSE
jgi:hypothetical protein